MGVGQVLTMPLFFASNAIYPTAIMPRHVHGQAGADEHCDPASLLQEHLSRRCAGQCQVGDHLRGCRLGSGWK